MSNPRITYHPPRDPAHPLRVDVVILHSRGNTKWCAQALSSAMDQLHDGTGVIVVDNNDHELSIGAGWNLAVRHSTAYGLLFMGDDDYISIDLSGFLVGLLNKLRKRPDTATVVLVTSGMTMVNEQDQVINEVKRYPHTTGRIYLQQHHTGLFLRDYLHANPFDETLARHVDTHAVSRLHDLEKGTGLRRMFACGYHYGYHYRQHIGMVSGRKLSVLK